MTERERRVLRLGGAVVLGATLALRVVPSGVRAVLSGERAVDQRAALLAHARAELADVGGLSARAAALTRALSNLAPELLAGETPAEATADLVERLTLIAARHNARLERTDQVPDSASGGRLRRIRVRIELAGDIAGMTGVLRTLAGGDAAVSVEALRIVAPDPGTGAGAPEALRAELTVAGWYLGRSLTHTQRNSDGP